MKVTTPEQRIRSLRGPRGSYPLLALLDAAQADITALEGMALSQEWLSSTVRVNVVAAAGPRTPVSNRNATGTRSSVVSLDSAWPWIDALDALERVSAGARVHEVAQEFGYTRPGLSNRLNALRHQAEAARERRQLLLESAA
jgi:hypothetical protein